MKKLIMFVMVIAIAVPFFSGIASANVPTCVTICPAGAGPDDLITLTAYDEEGVKVDLSLWTCGIEMNFAPLSIEEWGFLIFPEDPEMVDGTVQIVLGEERYGNNWDFFTCGSGEEVDAAIQIAGGGEPTIEEVVAAGGTCEDLAGCPATSPFVIDPNVMLVYETGETVGDFDVSLVNKPEPEEFVTVTVDPNEAIEDITLIGGDPCEGGTITLIFDANNWDVPQTVVFKAIDDEIAEPPELLEQQRILLTSVYSEPLQDPNWAGQKIVTVNVMDNDQANILFTLTPAEQHNPKNPLLPGTPVQVSEQPRWQFGWPLKRWREIGVTLQVEPVNDDPCKVGYVRVIVANEGESGNQPIMWLNPEWDFNEPLPPIDEPNAIVFTSDGTAVSGVIGVVSEWDESYPILIYGNDDDVLQAEEAFAAGNENYGASLLFFVESTSDERFAVFTEEEPKIVGIDIEDNECGAYGISYLDVGNPNAATDPNYQDDDGNPLPDCYVDIYDVIEFTTQWLDCSDPQDPACEPYL